MQGLNFKNSSVPHLKTWSDFLFGKQVLSLQIHHMYPRSFQRGIRVVCLCYWETYEMDNKNLNEPLSNDALRNCGCKKGLEKPVTDCDRYLT